MICAKPALGYKRNANKENIPVTKEELKNNTEKFMNMLIENRVRVANYFQHPKISYAA